KTGRWRRESESTISIGGEDLQRDRTIPKHRLRNWGRRRGTEIRVAAIGSGDRMISRGKRAARERGRAARQCSGAEGGRTIPESDGARGGNAGPRDRGGEGD